MSRSYKHELVIKDHNKGAKNFANRRVRRFRGEIADGSSYRKITERWDICDWKMRYNPETRVRSWGGVQTITEPDPVWKWRCK